MSLEFCQHKDILAARLFQCIACLLFMAVIACSCNNHSKVTSQYENDSLNIQSTFNAIKIENRINRGARFKGEDGLTYWLIHVASIISNQSDQSITLSLNFSTEYQSPPEFGNESYNIFILPEVFADDNIPKTTEDGQFYMDSVVFDIHKQHEVQNIELYQANYTLNPGEAFAIPIGTLFKKNSKCDIIPNLLISQDDFPKHENCQVISDNKNASKECLPLALKVLFRHQKTTENCSLVQCGQIDTLL